jgi:beta-mannosidase
MGVFDRWKLKDYAPAEGDVSAPGDVYQALIASGRIPDPYYDRNELDCAWVEEREWWYRAQFIYEHGPPQTDERLLLVFHGLE